MTPVFMRIAPRCRLTGLGNLSAALTVIAECLSAPHRSAVTRPPPGQMSPFGFEEALAASFPDLPADGVITCFGSNCFAVRKLGIESTCCRGRRRRPGGLH